MQNWSTSVGDRISGRFIDSCNTCKSGAARIPTYEAGRGAFVRMRADGPFHSVRSVRCLPTNKQTTARRSRGMAAAEAASACEADRKDVLGGREGPPHNSPSFLLVPLPQKTADISLARWKLVCPHQSLAIQVPVLESRGDRHHASRRSHAASERVLATQGHTTCFGHIGRRLTALDVEPIRQRCFYLVNRPASISSTCVVARGKD